LEGASLQAEYLRTLLDDVRRGTVSPDEAFNTLRHLPYEELGFAKVDHHRALRQGFPEVIYAEGKTPSQVASIAAAIHQKGATVLATRASAEQFTAVTELVPGAQWFEQARIIRAPGADISVSNASGIEGDTAEAASVTSQGLVGVICAGTTDIPVAEEAALTVETMGAEVERIYDVGVAGLHRLLSFGPTLQRCDVLICVAGMEGALPSVVGGLVEIPVIAVPTSVGYGAAFGGVAALLGMLNSCAKGLAVVNIDNGFGAGAFAASILRTKNRTGGHGA
jgi:NCAIR mutase (PurE)-related protein